MFITGVDWSGDGGLTRKGISDRDILVIAFASIWDDDRARINRALKGVRARNQFREGDVFKHSDSSDRVRFEFFEAIMGTGIEVRVRMINKTGDWPPDYSRLNSNQRVASSIAAAASMLPAHLIENGTLLLDLNQKKDGKLCTMTVGAIHRATRNEAHRGFQKVKCCPDTDSTLGEIVQVADMVAGAIRRARVLEPASYPNWNRLVVPW